MLIFDEIRLILTFNDKILFYIDETHVLLTIKKLLPIQYLSLNLRLYHKYWHSFCYNFNKTLNYKTQYRYNTFKSIKPLGSILLKSSEASKLFQIYTTFLTQTTVVTAQTHPSHRFNFILNKKLNISTFNLTKLKHK